MALLDVAAYDGGDPRVNGTSTFPPGAKENGGIFCHAAAWSVVAAAQLGDGDRAYEYYRSFSFVPARRREVGGGALRLFARTSAGPPTQYGWGATPGLPERRRGMYLAPPSGSGYQANPLRASE